MVAEKGHNETKTKCLSKKRGKIFFYSLSLLMVALCYKWWTSILVSYSGREKNWKRFFAHSYKNDFYSVIPAHNAIIIIVIVMCSNFCLHILCARTAQSILIQCVRLVCAHLKKCKKNISTTQKNISTYRDVQFTLRITP